MPAPSLTTLLDFETEWDRALSAVIGAAVPWTVAEAHSTNTLTTPYVTATFVFDGMHQIGANPLQRGPNTTTAQQFDGVSYRGQIVFEIVVDRRSFSSAEMKATRGGIRAAMLPSAATFNAITLPYYTISSLEEVSGSRSIDEDRDLDVTQIAYAMTWGIRPGAWPT